ncbi:MAG: VCBS repeat-containing protein [Verrucomicrobia bacterium]|nr:VCBS repeat-containing protein [Verrucomicrobiota bacterium]
MNKRGQWIEKGFESFTAGALGNAGQNLYVSRAGVLQRIHRFDVNGDGHVDLLFVNSQDNGERPPVYVYHAPLNGKRSRRASGQGGLFLQELPADGAYAGAVGDLNGDGYDDLALAMNENGIRRDLNAFVYFGGPEGMSERYKLELPAPNSCAVAIGDFNGDGRPDLVFSSNGHLRVFYQGARGFLPDRFAECKLDVRAMAAADLDGDGCADLYVKESDGGARILWGGPEGISAQRSTPVLGPDAAAAQGQTSGPPVPDGVILAPGRGWLPKIVFLERRPRLFYCRDARAFFIPVNKDRSLGEAWTLETGPVRSVAAGDFNGDGFPDLVFASNQRREGGEVSWVYWGTAAGFDAARRTPLASASARDVVAGDLDGDGCDDIVICQERTSVMCTTESRIYRGSRRGVFSRPVRLLTHDAQAAFIARTCAEERRQVIFVNNVTGRVRADISSHLYYGGRDGFRADRRDDFPGWAAADALCCDFNDDGMVDVFLANSAENSPGFHPGSNLYWGSKNGFHPRRKLVLPTIHAIGTACADFNRDGHLDIAVVGFSNPDLLIFYGSPDGFDPKHPCRIRLEKDGVLCDDARRPFAADFNNDGWLDLVIPQCNTSTLILWGGPDGFSMERSTFLNAKSCAGVNAADLTGSGWLDLILGGHHGPDPDHCYETYVYIYWGGPEGFREERRAQLPAFKANKVAVADFNNDGCLDLFVTSYHSGRTRDLDSYIYWGAPNGVYSAENRSRLFNHSSCACVAADFNEDGWVDLAVANHKWHGNHQGHSIIWWNGSDGFNEERQTILPTSGPHGMVNVDPGNVMDRGPEEYFVSRAHELPPGAKVDAISWLADVPRKTWVRAQLRFAETPDGLARAPWLGPRGANSWFGNRSPIRRIHQAGRWMQYRLALGAVNGGNTPRVRQVTVGYRM